MDRASAAAAGPASAAAGGEATTSAPAAPADPLQASWPQDVRIRYQLQGQFRGGPLFGSARVQWQRAGSQYQTLVELQLPLGNTLIYTSQGVVTAEGLVPQAYEEARGSRRRQTRMTDREVILQDGRTLPRPAGLQDLASQFIELGHRLRTGQFPAAVGSSVTLPLARPGGIDTWTYDLTAYDTVRAPRLGDLATLRLTPRPQAPARGPVTAEFWFAPGLQHLPVRIRMSLGEEASVDLVVETIEQR